MRIFREGLLEEDGTLVVPKSSPSETADRGDAGPRLDHPVRITYASHTYPRFEEVAYLSTGDALTIGVGYHASIATEDVVFSLELRDMDGNCFMRTDTDILGLRFDLPVGPGLVNFIVDDIPLLDGKFSFSVGVLSKGGVLFDWREPAGQFDVMSPGKATGFITLPVRAVLAPPEQRCLASPRRAGARATWRPVRPVRRVHAEPGGARGRPRWQTRKIRRPTWPRSWPRSKRRFAFGAPRATCRPSSSASSTSSSWPIPRWPGVGAT